MPATVSRVNRGRLAAFGAVAALVGYAAYHRYAFLAASPRPVGVDGYFYPIQLRSLLETGRLYYADAPVVYWLMAPLAALFGPVAGAKLGAALGGALAGVPAYFLGRRLAAGDRAIGVLAAALVTTSALSFYLAAEFAQNGVAVTLALAAALAIARAADHPGRASMAVAVAALVVAALAHKTAGALAVVVGLAPAWRAGKLGARQLVAPAVALALVLIAGLLWPERVLGVRDLRLAGDLLSSDADWRLPALVVGDRALLFSREVLWAALAAAAALVAYRLDPNRGHGSAALVLGPAVFALAIALPWWNVRDPQSLAFRLRLLAFVPLALCAAYALGVAARRIPRSARTALAAAAALALVLARPTTSDEGVVRAHPALEAAARAVAVPADAVVICPERHMAYMVTWHTRTPVRLRPDPVPVDRRWRLLPMAHLDRTTYAAIDTARASAADPPRALHAFDQNGVVLIPEPTWDTVLATLPPELRARWESWPTR